MKALITGINGFAGTKLAEHLLDFGYEVFGMARSPRATHKLPPQVEAVSCDIGDAAAVQAYVGEFAPDLVFHLAAVTSAAKIRENPAEAYRVSVSGTETLLGALVKQAPAATVVIVGSAAEYGAVLPHENPINEDRLCAPPSIYGVNKLAQSYVGLRYFLEHNLKVIRVRPFNFTGPGQMSDAVVSSFCRQVVEIEFGCREPVLSVGNLDVCRDFSDVRDVVRAFHLAATKGEPGAIYNICSGQPVQIGGIVRRLRAMTSVSIDVRQSPQRTNARDISVMYGNPSRLCERTGWKPHHTLDQTLRDTLDACRARTASNAEASLL